MPFAASAPQPSDNGELLVSIAGGEGSCRHSWLHSPALNVGHWASRNMADLLGLLMLLHDGQPGMVETVRQHNVWKGADPWLAAVAEGCSNERAYVARLVAAAGPAPSTPGEPATIAAVLGQRQALLTIATSERFGCAIGAVAALVLDWLPIRAALDTAADRLGVGIARFGLPAEDATCAMLAALPDRPRLDRTLAFGARQVVTHHQMLLDLLETRARARTD